MIILVTAVFYVVNVLAMLSLSAAIAFFFFAFRAGASIHDRLPLSISIFFVLVPVLAFLVSLVVAWRCTRGDPGLGVLISALVCASVASLAGFMLLGLAFELTAARFIPDAVPILVYAAFGGIVSLLLAALINIGIIIKKILFIASV